MWCFLKYLVGGKGGSGGYGARRNKVRKSRVTLSREGSRRRKGKRAGASESCILPSAFWWDLKFFFHLSVSLILNAQASKACVDLSDIPQPTVAASQHVLLPSLGKECSHLP